MDKLRLYKEIPFVNSPRNFMAQVGPFLLSMYEQHGSLFRSQNPFGKGEVLYMVGPEANRFILTSNRLKFSYYQGWGIDGRFEPKFGHGLISMDGQEHAEHRRLLNPSFSSAATERYFKDISCVIDQYIANWRHKATVDMYEEARRITFAVIVNLLFGSTDSSETEALREVVTHLIHLGETPISDDLYQESIRLWRSQLEAFIKQKIEEHSQQASPDDILSTLLLIKDSNGNPALTHEQIMAHVNVLLVAGHDTTTSLTAWLFYLLSQNRDYLQRVLDEIGAILPGHVEPTFDTLKQMHVLDNAFSEAQRLYPPIPHGPRGVLEDFEFNGFLIPAGSRVFYSIIATHLMPSIFTEPTRFDPDRFAPPREEHKKTPYVLVAFGGGPRICLGINLAEVEIKLTVISALKQYRFELLAGQKIIQIYAASGAPYKGIKMAISPF